MSAPPPSSSARPESKSLSISLSSKKPTTQRPGSSIALPRRPPSQSSTPRPRFLDHDSDASDAENTEAKAEEVTGFDQSAGGAISRHAREKEKQPLVIKVDKKNGWRERLLSSTRARGRSWLPEEVRAQREAEARGGAEDAAVEEEAFLEIDTEKEEEGHVSGRSGAACLDQRKQGEDGTGNPILVIQSKADLMMYPRV
ncbi:predicted protein [Uncinocarpus reesii 1704]|uniref:Uncharacterized protein n=1 Tax=Uncinocarpus reesii (strain UAMH 1704) TaxID=336963 RepID=C4JUH0_UNCRE|nr:uncharacterized protein UREG_04773 [Uncinocarpus reesii 1704]EEP79931.1 predicted protein [Uncinocarpus reesii 1704]